MLFHRLDPMMWCCFDSFFFKFFLGSAVIQASFVHMMRMVHEVFMNIVIIVIVWCIYYHFRIVGRVM